LTPASGWPLSAQLAQLLRELIRSGQLIPGDRVPSEPQLAPRPTPCPETTAQRALAMLANEGLITRRRGVGSIVATVDPVTEGARGGAGGPRISARLPTAGRAERRPGRVCGFPMLAVVEPGWPETPLSRGPGGGRGPGRGPGCSRRSGPLCASPPTHSFPPPTSLRARAASSPRPSLSLGAPYHSEFHRAVRRRCRNGERPSWMTVRRTSSTTSSSVSQIAQMARREDRDPVWQHPPRTPTCGSSAALSLVEPQQPAADQRRARP